MNGSDARRSACLQAMGIVAWRARGRGVTGEAPELPPPATDPALEADLAQAGPAEVDLAGSDLDALRVTVAACRRCVLCESRSQTVFGTGPAPAPLMIIGEAPGAEEDARGEPFVGRAGALLNAMLSAIGLPREQVYIANILKCRPPRNRDPHGDEVVACADYLHRQIQLVGPRLLLAVGRVAAQNLLGVTTPIGKMRGHEHTHAASGLPVLVTYHPAYLLRSPVEKRKAWADLCTLRLRLERLGAVAGREAAP